jgi:hypothetical protein
MSAPLRKTTLVLFAVLLIVAALAGLALYDMRARPQADATVIILTESSNDSSTSLGPGQSVRIELRTNPSTGYNWKLVEGKATPAPQIAFPDPERRPGGGSVLQPFLVRYADLPTTVKIALIRPMMDQPPAQIFTVTLKRR